jgi:nitrate reductase NapAB chaperone NapD
MSISFACEECGKSFTIDDKFAGKKGRCKGCGAVMQIPEAGTPVEDVYGFEDAPLPPRSTSFARGPAEASTSAAPVARKKKKAQGFFAGFGGKSSSSGGFSSSGSSRVLLGVGGVILTAIILPALRGSFNGFAPRSQIAAYYQGTLDRGNQLTAMLRKVHDVPSAQQSSNAIREHLRQMTQYIRDNMNRKGNKADIEQLKAQFVVQQAQMEQALLREVQRLSRIPGVIQALNIMSELEEQSNLEKQAEAIAK